MPPLEDILAAAVIAATFGSLTRILAEGLWRWRLRGHLRRARQPMPGERLQKSIAKLTETAKEIDAGIQEALAEIHTRTEALEVLGSRNKALAEEEAERKKRIESLSKVPIEVAEYFDKISRASLKEMEQRGARRDWVFFIAGAVVTAASAIVLRFLNLA